MGRFARVTILTLVIAVALIGWLGLSHATPDGQPPLAEVTAESIAALKADFNRAAGGPRIVILLAPTISAPSAARAKRRPARVLGSTNGWRLNRSAYPSLDAATACTGGSSPSFFGLISPTTRGSRLIAVTIFSPSFSLKKR